MKRGQTIRAIFRTGVASTATALTLFGTTAAAAANDTCFTLSVHYSLLDGPDEYLLGPDHCVADTAWSDGVTLDRELEAVVVNVGLGARITWPL